MKKLGNTNLIYKRLKLFSLVKMSVSTEELISYNNQVKCPLKRKRLMRTIEAIYNEDFHVIHVENKGLCVGILYDDGLHHIQLHEKNMTRDEYKLIIRNVTIPVRWFM
jgi:dTDP-4-dehydrorhamnose reductase